MYVFLTPTTIQRSVREGTLKATQLGNEDLFSDRDLADFLLWKNGHKRLMGVRSHKPRARALPNGHAAVEGGGLQISRLAS